MKTQVLVIAATCVLLGGCASIMRGSSQSVGITTPPVTGATCNLSSKEGTWQVVSPGAVTVERSKDDIQIRCTKEGYQEAVAMIPSNFEGWTVGNLVFGGIIGVGVDAATGAMNQYPKSFQVPMQPVSGVTASPAPGATPAPAGAPATTSAAPSASTPKPAKP
jgi:hypothetical protein